MDAVSTRRIEGAGTSAQAWQADPALAQLAQTTLAALVPPGARAVLVAPHPDDEVLAWGGLLQLLAARAGAAGGDEPAPLLVALTDGEASHPGSTLWPRERLRSARPVETAHALAALGLAPGWVATARLGIADGGIAGNVAAAANSLARLLVAGDVLFATWRLDAHPDHEACAHACALACAGSTHAGGHALFETPVWGWHWNCPGANAMPLAQASRLPLSPLQLVRKRQALDCFASQRSADPGGAAPVLADSTVERALLGFELFFPCQH